MFGLLPASSSRSEINRRSVIAAIVIHLLVIGFGIAATRSLANATKGSTRAEPVLLLMPRRAEPPIEAERLRNPRVGPPPERFQHIPLPTEAPPAVPPIDLSRRPFDPHDFLRIGPEQGPAQGESRGTIGAPEAIYQASSGLEGFESAVVIAQPTPQYPPALLSAGATGAVLLEFVVDTAGRVETESVRVVESSHGGFNDAARMAVLGARFHPARLRGHAVRQISRQQVRFVAE
jgi:TonB family protein